MINASDLLGAPQIGGVVVSPIGLFRKIESSTTAFAGGIVVPGKLGPMIGDKLGGSSAAEQRRRVAAVSDSTPKCGEWGYLAVTDVELALTATEAPKWVGRRRDRARALAPSIPTRPPVRTRNDDQRRDPSEPGTLRP